MTLKGKNKFLRNIIVCLVAVVFVAGIAGIVYSQNNASIKISFKDNTWDTGKEQVPSKEWFMNANENEVKFIVDLSDYKIESTNSGENGGENTTPPVEPEQPENPDNGEIGNPPVGGSEEGNEIPDNVEVVSEGENTQPDENNGEVNTPENNETTDKGEVKYPNLSDVMNIDIATENTTVEFGNIEIDQYLEEQVIDGVKTEVFKGKYEVTIPLNNKVDIDYNINIELVVKENDFEIPVTSDENPAKSFRIVKDNTIPTISTNLTDNEIIKVDKKIEMYFNEEVDFSFEFYKCEDIEDNIDEKKESGDKFIYEMDKSEFVDGDYKLKIAVMDKAGNSNSYEVLFTINKNKPNVTINGEEIKTFYNKDFYNEDEKLILQLKANDNNGMDTNKSRFKLVKPGQNPQSVAFEKFDSMDNNINIVTKEIDLSDEGVYLLTVEAYDNKEAGGVIFTDKKIIVDKSPATIDINVNEKSLLEYNKFEEMIYVNKNEFKFNFYDENEFKNIDVSIEGTITENSENISEKLNVSLDGKEISKVKQFKDGVYTVTINTEDKAGNKTVEQIFNFTVDTDPVDVKFDGDIRNGEHYNEDKTLEVKLEDDNLNLSKDNNRININKDGTDLEEVFFEEDKNILSKSFTEEGTYTVTVFATDKAGNETKNTITFTIDKTKPVITMEDYTTLQGSFNKENKTLKIKVKEKNLTGDSKIKLTYTIPAYEDEDGNKHEGQLGEVTLLEIPENEEYEKEEYEIEYEVGTDIDWEVIESIDYKVEFNVIDKAGNKSILNPSKEHPEGIAIDNLNFTIDKARPVITMDDYTTLQNSFNKEDKTLNITVNEKNLTKDSKIELTYTIPAYKDKDENTYKEEAKNVNLLEGVTPSDGVYQIEYTVGTDIEWEFIESIDYKVEFNVIDKAGNKSILNPSKEQPDGIATDYLKFTIDKTKPVINIIAEAKDNNPEGENEVVEISNRDGVVINNGRHINTENVQLNIDITDSNLQGDISYVKPGEGTTEKANNIISIVRTFEGTNYEVETEVDYEESNENGKITLNANINLEGKYTIYVESTDKATNDNKKELEFVIDRTSPEVTIEDIDNIKNKFLPNITKLGIDIKEEQFDDSTIGIKIDKLSPEEGQPVSIIVDESTSPEGGQGKIENKKNEYNLSELVNKENNGYDGKYTVTITGKDKAGNDIVGDTSLEFVVDTQKPEFNFSGFDKENNHYNTDRKITITVKEDNQSKNEIIIKKDGVEFKKEESIPQDSKKPSMDNYAETPKYTEFKYDFNANPNGEEDGEYEIKVTSTDAAGLVSEKTHKFVIDTKTPVVTLPQFNTLNNNFVKSNELITVEIEETNLIHKDTEVVVEILRKIPNADTESILKVDQNNKTEEYKDRFKEDAIYTVKITGKDAADNAVVVKDSNGNTISNEMCFTIDNTKPVATIADNIVEGQHYNRDMEVSVSITDVNHKDNKVTITKNGQELFTSTNFSISGKNNDNDEVKKATLSHTLSEEGEYVVTVMSTDKAGNELTPKVTRTFTIDKTKPVITPVFKGEGREIKDGEYINKIFTPEFKLDEAEDKFDYIKLNDVEIGSVPMSSTEMVYHYSVQASDNAGNITPYDITFTVDVTNPEVKVTGIIDGYFSKDMKPEYEITDTNLDNENTIVTLNDKVFESGTKIEDQDYYNLKLLGADLASNTTARNIVFAIDKDKPVIKFLEQMSGKYFTEDFIPNFIIEDLTDYTIIAMTLDGVDYEIGDPITEEGKHVLYIEVKDKAENVESISVEFILDKTPPKFIVNGIKDKGIYVEPVTAEITLENPLDKIIGITVNGELAQGDVKEENGQQVVKLNFTDINDYEVVLKAVDEAGNETEEVINFKIAKKNIFTTIYANKTIFYPLVIALAIIAVIVVITVVRKNKKEETQEEGSEE